MAAVAAPDADVRPGETLCRPCVGVAWRRAYRRPAAQGACLLVCEETVVAELVARGDRGSQETRRDSADDPRRTFRSGTGAGAADHRAFALRPHRAEQGMAGREQPDARAADGRRGARRRGPGSDRRGDRRRRRRGHSGRLVVSPARTPDSVRELRTGLCRGPFVLAPGSRRDALYVLGRAVRRHRKADAGGYLPEHLAGCDGPEFLRPAGVYRQRSRKSLVGSRRRGEHRGAEKTGIPGFQAVRQEDTGAGEPLRRIAWAALLRPFGLRHLPYRHMVCVDPHALRPYDRLRVYEPGEHSGQLLGRRGVAVHAARAGVRQYLRPLGLADGSRDDGLRRRRAPEVRQLRRGQEKPFRACGRPRFGRCAVYDDGDRARRASRPQVGILFRGPRRGAGCGHPQFRRPDFPDHHGPGSDAPCGSGNPGRSGRDLRQPAVGASRRPGIRIAGRRSDCSQHGDSGGKMGSDRSFLQGQNPAGTGFQVLVRA